MKTKILLLAAVLLSVNACKMVSSTGLNFAPEHQVPTVVITPAKTPLERARRATFAIALPSYFVSGSAVIIDRRAIGIHTKFTGPKQYVYQALTARHVVGAMIQEIKQQGESADQTAMVMFQPHLHGLPLRMKISIDKVEQESIDYDWALFTFHSKHRFEFVELATKREFQAIKAFETIYAVGCDAGFGQLCRRGILGATHNEHMTQVQRGHIQWTRHPHAFFRPFIQAWYGASGGGVFNQHGKLIGLINGSSMGKGRNAVTHAIVSIKAHLILEQLNASKK
ncbi:MAG: S1 family peptidase [Candidatus Thorarchaeota archaeon]